MPAMIFISVDLPAPFSPMRACTEPRFSRNWTSSSARTPGNSLRTCSTSSRYSAFGTAPLSRTACMVVGLNMPLDPRPRSRTLCPGGAGWFHPRRRSRRRSLVLGSVFIHIGGSDELEGNVDLAIDLLALGELHRRIEGAVALT